MPNSNSEYEGRRDKSETTVLSRVPTASLGRGEVRYFNPIPDTAPQDTRSHPLGLAFGHNWTIKSNLANNFRYGLTRENFLGNEVFV